MSNVAFSDIAARLNFQGKWRQAVTEQTNFSPGNKKDFSENNLIPDSLHVP